MPRTYSATNADISHPSANTRGAFARALTALVASCTMNWVRALSSAVRAFGLHPKGRPFKSDSAHHCDASPFSGDVVQLVRTLPCRWLESYTVTAEPHNHLPHRTFNHLERDLKFLDRREVQSYKTKRTGRPRKCSGQRIFAVE